MIYHITDDGYALLIRAMAGEPLRFTKVGIGDNNMEPRPPEFRSRKELVGQKYETSFDSIRVLDGHAELTWHLDTAELEETMFYWLETGIFAADPDGGGDILYAYANALEDEEIWDKFSEVMIPKNQADIGTYISQVTSVYIGEITDVSAEIAHYMPFAAKKDFDAHTAARNPHGTTWEDIGLTREAIGIRLHKVRLQSESRVYSVKKFYIPFSVIPETATLFFGYSFEGATELDSDAAQIAFTVMKTTSNSWEVTACMYNFTGPVEVRTLGIG